MGVALGEELLFRRPDLRPDPAVRFPVLDPDRGCALVHRVLQEVRRAVLAVLLLKTAEAIPQRRGDARDVMILDQQDAESVVEHQLVDVDAERRPPLDARRSTRLRATDRAPPAGDYYGNGEGEADGQGPSTAHDIPPLTGSRFSCSRFSGSVLGAAGG